MFALTETFFINLSFLNLLANSIFSWIAYSFNFKKLNLLIFCNITSVLFYSGFFLLRWANSGHVPISNLYESLIFLSFTLLIGSFWMYSISKNLLIYCISSPVPLLINAFASFALSTNLQESSPLIPALKSNWLLMHVSVMIVSYATLILGSLLSISFLILAFFVYNKQKNQNANISFLNFQILESSEVSESFSNSLFILLNNLDNLSYRFIGISFPFLTIGIISGAVWANETWGSYWNWDPKETWALITWLVFAIYLHFRLIKGKRGVLPAVIASFGFIVVWICYLGVNLLGKGLHSYGWFN